MILTGSEIKKQREEGNIFISPFDEKNLGPNSYDLTLSNFLKVYENHTLDMKLKNKVHEIKIKESGFRLEPGILYIGSTNESAISRSFVPMFEGRSSIGRLGVYTHITAGFGDIGWGYEVKEDHEVIHAPTWTLEINVVQPITIYPNVKIGQVYFIEPKGDIKYYNGKYGKQVKPQESMLYKDFKA